MLASCLLIAIASAGFADGATSAADAVTLSDGTVVLGQVLEATPRGQLVLLVRREWAKTNAPAWLMKWEADEAPLVRAPGVNGRRGSPTGGDYARERPPPGVTPSSPASTARSASSRRYGRRPRS